jgi:Domain of unknown function (DUF3883)
MNEQFAVGFASVDFTEVFVEQLVQVIAAIPSHQAGGLDSEGISAMLQSCLGVGNRSSRNVVACLTQMRLISEIDGMIGRSRTGDALRRDIRANGSYTLAVAILRSGLMADQIRALRPVLRAHANGYACGRSLAQTTAPQLVGLLSRMPDVSISGQMDIGRVSGLELDSVWNELPPGSRLNWQDAERRRKAIGDRAELYSLQLLRSSHVGAWENIGWVSRDDDSLGYDIEVRGIISRQVEVKGSSGRDVQFFLSSNEYRVAEACGAQYEIHFWGDIRIESDPVEEFQRLTAAGFPICIVDPVSILAQPPWIIKPSQYRVFRNVN